jgi:hypothetical protein
MSLNAHRLGRGGIAWSVELCLNAQLCKFSMRKLIQNTSCPNQDVGTTRTDIVYNIVNNAVVSTQTLAVTGIDWHVA